MPRGESMRFATPEMSMAGERAEIESKLTKLADQMAAIEKGVRAVGSPGETLSAILEMEKIQSEMAPLKADLRRLSIIEAAGGVEAGFKEEAIRTVEKRAENAEAIKEARKQVEALSAELEKAEKTLSTATGAKNVLDAITTVDRLQAQITALETSARRLAIDNLSLASDLHTLKEKGITEEVIPFTPAENKWFESGKNRSDFWEMDAAEREAAVSDFEESFLEEAA